MSSNWGTQLKVSLFGESHGKGIGAVLDGVPAGIPINEENIRTMMLRRAPGQGLHSTPRKEGDYVELLSGIYNGFTTGTPIAGIIYNKDTRSKDYANMPLRPSHADYTGHKRYNGYNDPRGGGHFSGRITAPLTFAGAIAKQVLEFQFDIVIGAHIAQIYTVEDHPHFTRETVTKDDLRMLNKRSFPTCSPSQGKMMLEQIEEARMGLDSLGGIVACYAVGLPAGIGSPMFDGLENKIAGIIFGVPAVRGIEFGLGFAAAGLKASEHNDPYKISHNTIQTQTNHHGGIIGGISSGMPLALQVAFKPTPSIARAQQSVDIATMEETTLEIHGRHDPCIVPRAVPVVEAAVAIALLDALLEGGNPNATWNIPQAN